MPLAASDRDLQRFDMFLQNLPNCLLPASTLTLWKQNLKEFIEDKFPSEQTDFLLLTVEAAVSPTSQEHLDELLKVIDELSDLGADVNDEVVEKINEIQDVVEKQAVLQRLLTCEVRNRRSYARLCVLKDKCGLVFGPIEDEATRLRLLQSFKQAINDNNMVAIEFLSKEIKDPYAKNRALKYALQCENYCAADYLIYSGVDVFAAIDDEPIIDSANPSRRRDVLSMQLIYKIADRSFDVAQANTLIAQGANINYVNHYGTNPLWQAILAKNHALAKNFLQNENLRVDVKDDELLSMAACLANEENFKFLLDKGFDIYRKYKKHQSEQFVDDLFSKMDDISNDFESNDNLGDEAKMQEKTQKIVNLKQSKVFLQQKALADFVRGGNNVFIFPHTSSPPIDNIEIRNVPAGLGAAVQYRFYVNNQEVTEEASIDYYIKYFRRRSLEGEEGRRQRTLQEFDKLLEASMADKAVGTGNLERLHGKDSSQAVKQHALTKAIEKHNNFTSKQHTRLKQIEDLIKKLIDGKISILSDYKKILDAKYKQKVLNRALYIAADSGNFEEAQKLIKAGAKLEPDYEVTAGEVRSILGVAALRQDVPMTRLLVGGASEVYLQRVLKNAIDREDFEATRILIEAGAPVFDNSDEKQKCWSFDAAADCQVLDAGGRLNHVPNSDIEDYIYNEALKQLFEKGQRLPAANLGRVSVGKKTINGEEVSFIKCPTTKQDPGGAPMPFTVFIVKRNNYYVYLEREGDVDLVTLAIPAEESMSANREARRQKLEAFSEKLSLLENEHIKQKVSAFVPQPKGTFDFKERPRKFVPGEAMILLGKIEKDPSSLNYEYECANFVKDNAGQFPILEKALTNAILSRESAKKPPNRLGTEGLDFFIEELVRGGAEVLQNRKISDLATVSQEDHLSVAKIKPIIECVTDEEYKLKLMNLSMLDAAKRNKIYYIAGLIDRGADPLTAKDEQGNNILHLAMQSQSLDVLSEMVRRYPALLDQYNSENYTPLTLAAAAGSWKSIEFLMKSGEDKNAYLNKADRNDRTPLIAAAAQGQVQVVKSLLEVGVVNFEARDNSRRNAKEVAQQAMRENEIVAGTVLDDQLRSSSKHDGCKEIVRLLSTRVRADERAADSPLVLDRVDNTRRGSIIVPPYDATRGGDAKFVERQRFPSAPEVQHKLSITKYDFRAIDRTDDSGRKIKSRTDFASEIIVRQNRVVIRPEDLRFNTCPSNFSLGHYPYQNYDGQHFEISPGNNDRYVRLTGNLSEKFKVESDRSEGYFEPYYSEFRGLHFVEEEGASQPKIFGAAFLFMANFANCVFQNVDFSQIDAEIMRSMRFHECQFDNVKWPQKLGKNVVPNIVTTKADYQGVTAKTDVLKGVKKFKEDVDQVKEILKKDRNQAIAPEDAVKINGVLTNVGDQYPDHKKGHGLAETQKQLAPSEEIKAKSVRNLGSQTNKRYVK